MRSGSVAGREILSAERVARVAGSVCRGGARTSGESSSRRRGTRKFTYKLIALALVVGLIGTSAAAISPPPDPIGTTRGAIIYYPRDRFEGWRYVAVTRLFDGRLDVSYEPSLLYQDATTSSTHVDGSPLVVRYLEIITNLQPGNATHAGGFRDGARIRSCCPVLDFDAAAGGETVEVWTNNDHDYLVVISKKGSP